MTTLQTKGDYRERILNNVDNCLTETDLRSGEKYRGKVRDRYDLGDCLALVTTDRQSAFDRVLAAIPFKGQALNLSSQWWFYKTSDIVANHVLDVPDPNVTMAEKCEVFPIEFVVRGYLTGSSGTSLWTVYNKGDREYCGHLLPEGMVKNQPLDQIMLTPTTKEAHDRPISEDGILNEGWMTEEDWRQASAVAMELFSFGQRVASEHGLILVDTKYEMGKDAEGNLTLVDEIHTQDSSRYWIADSYEELHAAGQEPENVDKEFLRLWFSERCDPYKDEELPAAPVDLVTELSRRYLLLYEMITGEAFPFPSDDEPVGDRIARNLSAYL
ncbi:MAG: phosphoribosylaminoimidazolesuccinocarboxamide synthase [Opitutales bacterium]